MFGYRIHGIRMGQTSSILHTRDAQADIEATVRPPNCMASYALACPTLCRVLTAALRDWKALAMAIVLHYGSPDDDLLELLRHPIRAMHACQLELGYWHLFQMLGSGPHRHLRMGNCW